jgi:dTDP-4-amino-4,6-dideoxygalactose transaminase
MLVVNDERFADRAEIIWEKGTNRSAFFKGEVDKYGWVDIGSSFLPSDMIAAFLWAQLENLDCIQKRRKEIWQNYLEGLVEWAKKNEVQLPMVPDFASNNAHMFYMVCSSLMQRDELLKGIKEKKIYAVFHYQSLHKSPYFTDKHDGRECMNSDRYSECLVRLPFYFELEVSSVISKLVSHGGQ